MRYNQALKVDNADDLQNYSQYGPKEQHTWSQLFLSHFNSLKGRAHEAFYDGISEFNLTSHSIPHFEDLNETLERYGWKIRGISRFLPPTEYAELIMNGIIPVNTKIRSGINGHVAEPDLFHDLLGHIPMLVEPNYRTYMKQIAQEIVKSQPTEIELEYYESMSLLCREKQNQADNITPNCQSEEGFLRAKEALTEQSRFLDLCRLYWWTIEMGVVGPIEQPKAYGAAILSSTQEADHAFSGLKIVPFSRECARNFFDPNEYQPQYYRINSLADLSEILAELKVDSPTNDSSNIDLSYLPSLPHLIRGGSHHESI